MFINFPWLSSDFSLGYFPSNRYTLNAYYGMYEIGIGIGDEIWMIQILPSEDRLT